MNNRGEQNENQSSVIYIDKNVIYKNKKCENAEEKMEKTDKTASNIKSEPKKTNLIDTIIARMNTEKSLHKEVGQFKSTSQQCEIRSLPNFKNLQEKYELLESQSSNFKPKDFQSDSSGSMIKEEKLFKTDLYSVEEENKNKSDSSKINNQENNKPEIGNIFNQKNNTISNPVTLIDNQTKLTNKYVDEKVNNFEIMLNKIDSEDYKTDTKNTKNLKNNNADVNEFLHKNKYNNVVSKENFIKNAESKSINSNEKQNQDFTKNNDNSPVFKNNTNVSVTETILKLNSNSYNKNTNFYKKNEKFSDSKETFHVGAKLKQKN
ncbi:hypothetical protein EDEG_02335 [Edhazardia aedis USNM 41457]|uniref:Uncharacterized protein n=1 Tax=Edhazardia aedis (strain USNM 41457) TaxID=1003232 RepID=J9DPP3_EDHAE|nr:hypothetical protein EDEG_02335 [Edhazardia aedis USNM 41457]|eukprot:EJW03327.1 hypothetical protein EDEG_02335 [Edhazardia aedis USNM 41457]